MARPLARFVTSSAAVVGLAGALTLACAAPPAGEEAPAVEPMAEEVSVGPAVTQSLAAQVAPGMSVEDVATLLGRDGELDPIDFYRWDGVVVAFRDGEAVEATGTTGVLGKTLDEIAESRGGPGEKVERVRYVWENDSGLGSLSVDFEGGEVVGRTATMLPES